MAIVKHPKNRHVMAANAKSKTYVTRAVKPNRKAERVAATPASDGAAVESALEATDPIESEPQS
jgi:hypothetical protein